MESVRDRARAAMEIGDRHIPEVNSCLLNAMVVEKIISYLSFKDLKMVRLLNHYWFYATGREWKNKSQIRFSEIRQIKQLLSTAANVRKVLPYTVANWTFQGETMYQLMSDRGHCQQEMLKPFWPCVRTLTLSNWFITRIRVVPHFPDPVNNPQLIGFRTIPYRAITRMGFTRHVIQMLTLCENLTKLVIHYPLLSRIQGGNIGPRQFPTLKNLNSFEVYFNGRRWDDEITPNGDDLLAMNLEAANRFVVLPSGEKSGGRTLILRILDHSPNLVQITVTSRTLLSSRLETWFMQIMFNESVKLPKLRDFRCSIPLQPIITRVLPAKLWKLGSLHIRILPGSSVQQKELNDMLTSFRDSLHHLELIFMGEACSTCFSVSKYLYNLKTLEIWGFNGSYSFLTEFRQLRSAIIGVTDSACSYNRLKEYLQQKPIPYLKVELKTAIEFRARLNKGPQVAVPV